MKRVLSIFSIFLCLASCQLDECMDLDCLNAGQCIDGSCACAEGFEGVNCNVREIDKFLGTFTQGRSFCDNGSDVLGSHLIAEVPFDHLAIDISDGVLDFPIRARVDGWNFVIPEQQNRYTDPRINFSEELTLEGQGWLDLNAGLLVYQLDNNGCRYELALN